MSKASKTSSTAPIIDVAHPGKSSPADTSKPIITSRKLMQDPMVTGAGDDKPAAPDLRESVAAARDDKKEPATKVHLQPGSDMTVPTAQDDTDDKEASQAHSEDTDVKLPAAETADLADSTAADTTTDESDDPKDPAQEQDKQLGPDSVQLADDKAEAARAEYDAKLQKVYDSKQYFLPINAMEHRRTARFVTLGIVLSVFLAIAWVDIALDASLIKLGDLKPVTNFFAN